MRIHKEGYGIIINLFVVFSLITLTASFFLPDTAALCIGTLLFILWFLIIRFFRVPRREVIPEEGDVYAPADGTVVAVEQTYEDEYLKEERIQVSVFMSIWNIHVNWYPLPGIIRYFKHHHGSFLVAWHPKSSAENERTTIVVDNGRTTILFRQIAGYVARRIVSYVQVGKEVRQNEQCGFIKFGSRVDVFLPLDAEINVELGDKVKGNHTVIAKLNKKA